MNAKVKSLVDVLRREEELYLEVRELLAAERQALIALDAPEVERATREKDLRIRELSLLEQARARVTREISRELSFSEEWQPNLGELAQALGASGRELLSVRETLRALVLSVKESGEANASLAERGLAGVRSTLDALGGGGVHSGSYSASGRSASDSASGRIFEGTA